MRALTVALLVGALIANAAFAQEQVESRGPRQDVIHGTGTHSVTLTFYVDNATTLQDIVSILAQSNTSGVFFLSQPLANSSLAQNVRNGGHIVSGWTDTSSYDSKYPPSKFAGIVLSDRSVFQRSSKMADVSAFYNLALHSQNSSTIAFTPAIPPRINQTQSIDMLEEILQDSDKTLAFVTAPSPVQSPLSIADALAAPLGVPAIGTNTTSSITLDAGQWDLSAIQSRYPSAIHIVSGLGEPRYLFNTTVIVSANASLDITNSDILFESPSGADKDRRIEVQGNLTMSNSEITSWNATAGAPDTNPYHERPFIFIDNGQLRVNNSTISQMGFLAGGLSEERTARAAITVYDGKGFSLVNSTLTHNIDALYARNNTGFAITGNEISANLRTGIDIRSGSSDLVILRNHIADNGYEGLICIGCSKASIAGNTIEHNAEAGIKLIMSNFTAVRDNDLKYNEKFGVFLRDGSSHNALHSNTIVQSREGIKLTGNSTDNILIANSLLQNDVPISNDATSSYRQMTTG